MEHSHFFMFAYLQGARRGIAQEERIESCEYFFPSTVSRVWDGVTPQARQGDDSATSGLCLLQT